MPPKPKTNPKKVETLVDPEDEPAQPLCDAIEEHVDSFIQEQQEMTDDLPVVGKMMPKFLIHVKRELS